MDEHSMEMDLYGTIFEGTDYGDQTKGSGDLELTNDALTNCLEMEQNGEQSDLASVKTKKNILVLHGEIFYTIIASQQRQSV